jgi:arylsulfatase A
MSDKPNIIYILADDMGYGDMGCNNPSSKIPTPNLDRLATQGMRFTDAHAASSVCSPSRYGLLTGRYCWRTPLKDSVLWPWDPPLIEPQRQTVARLLQQHGYRTACFGKWHLGWQWGTHNGQPGHQDMPIGKMDRQARLAMEANIDFSQPMRGGPLDCGFETYFGVDVPNFPPYTWFEQDHLTGPPSAQKPDTMFGFPGAMKPGWTLEEMIPRFVERTTNYITASGPAPFFLYFPLTSPHTPIVPNAPFIGTSGAGLYGDFVCEVDWVVGQVMAALEQKGIADNTLLIFSSDNGPECIQAAAGGSYEHARQYGHYSMADLRGVKRDTWEGGHRVPFIARWSGVTPAGAVCDQLVLLSDLLATCADMLDYRLKEGEGEDSISMRPILQGNTGTALRHSAVYHSCSGRFAMRQDDWVFIDAPSGDDNNEPEWFKTERGYTPHEHPGELFNLRDDLTERRNLYGERPQIVRELSQTLEHIKHAGSTPTHAADPATPQSE